MNNPIDVMDVVAQTSSALPKPFSSRMGVSQWRSLGDLYKLTHFGVNLEVLQPGAQSSLRHWHSKSEEFVYIVKGPVTLINNSGKAVLNTNSCVGFNAGEDDGHHFINHSNEDVQFLVVGSRVKGDEVVYPDDDIKWVEGDDGQLVATHKSGEKY